MSIKRTVEKLLETEFGGVLDVLPTGGIRKPGPSMSNVPAQSLHPITPDEHQAMGGLNDFNDGEPALYGENENFIVFVGGDDSQGSPSDAAVVGVFLDKDAVDQDAECLHFADKEECVALGSKLISAQTSEEAQGILDGFNRGGFFVPKDRCDFTSGDGMEDCTLPKGHQGDHECRMVR